MSIGGAREYKEKHAAKAKGIDTQRDQKNGLPL